MSSYTESKALADRFLDLAKARADACSGEYAASFLVGYLSGQIASLAASAPEAYDTLVSMVRHLEKAKV